MSQFIESICCIDGNAKLLPYHQDRVNRTFWSFFPGKRPLNLYEVVDKIPAKGKYKCRIVYNEKLVSIEYIRYKKPSINTLQVLEVPDIEYEYKFEDRSLLSMIYDWKVPSASDVIMVQSEIVKDSYYANLAFYDGDQWFTPAEPLLKGVKRQYLLDNKKLYEADITIDEIGYFEKVSLINAMIDLDEITVEDTDLFYYEIEGDEDY